MKIAELLQSLSGESAQYMLVGGLAVQLHGYMRSTFTTLGKCRLNRSVRPELVEGYFIRMILLFRSWFDSLTTNGINLYFPGEN